MTALGPIQFLTIHCAATPEGHPFTAEAISAMDRARFGQVSYHYVIELDGSLHSTLPDTELGAHVALHNHFNVGVCYIGGIDINGVPKDTRTPEQKAALRSIVATYKEKVPHLIVKGHRDWPNVHKACPSFDVATEL